MQETRYKRSRKFECTPHILESNECCNSYRAVVGTNSCILLKVNLFRSIRTHEWYSLFCVASDRRSVICLCVFFLVQIQSHRTRIYGKQHLFDWFIDRLYLLLFNCHPWSTAHSISIVSNCCSDKKSTTTTNYVFIIFVPWLKTQEVVLSLSGFNVCRAVALFHQEFAFICQFH